MDPLAQLNDIHLPDQIHHYPIALGWWVLVVMLIAALIFISLKVKHYKHIRKSRNQAIKQLAQANTHQDIVSILKWACLQYFPRETVAPLFGSKFYQFLRDGMPVKYQDSFGQGIEGKIDSIYQTQGSNTTPEIDLAFKEAALVFLSKALPPKNNKKSNIPLSSKSVAGKLPIDEHPKKIKEPEHV